MQPVSSCVLGFRVEVDHRAATYEEALGFRQQGEASYRIVQLTPPGSVSQEARSRTVTANSDS